MVLPLSWQVKDEICLCFEGCGWPLDIPCCVFICCVAQSSLRARI